jgi:hypothetical protein
LAKKFSRYFYEFSPNHCQTDARFPVPTRCCVDSEELQNGRGRRRACLGRTNQIALKGLTSFACSREQRALRYAASKNSAVSHLEKTFSG